MEKHRVQEQVVWAAAMLLLAIATVIAWHVVPAERNDWSVFDRVVNIVVATGTVAAVGVSLWLATSDRRARRGDEMVRAQLAAARLVADLERPLEELRHMVVVDGFDDLTQRQDPRQLQATRDLVAFDLLKSCTSRPQWHLDADLLVALVPLGNNVANRLEYGCRSLVALNVLIGEYESHWPAVPVSNQQALIRSWMVKCDDAYAYVSVAFGECQDAAQLGAPEPTPVERYGIPFDAE